MSYSCCSQISSFAPDCSQNVLCTVLFVLSKVRPAHRGERDDHGIEVAAIIDGNVANAGCVDARRRTNRLRHRGCVAARPRSAARDRRQRGADQGAGRRFGPGDLAHDDRHSVPHARHRIWVPSAEEYRAGLRRRGYRRRGRLRGHHVRGGRRGLRHRPWLLRRVRPGPESKLARSRRTPFEQHAVLAISGITALQALCDAGRIQAGPAGTDHRGVRWCRLFAIQLAKAFGAEVTGVCSAGKVDFVRSRCRSGDRLHRAGLHRQRPAATT